MLKSLTASTALVLLAGPAHSAEQLPSTARKIVASC